MIMLIMYTFLAANSYFMTFLVDACVRKFHFMTIILTVCVSKIFIHNFIKKIRHNLYCKYNNNNLDIYKLHNK